MKSNDFPASHSAAELRSRAARADNLALSATDELTISRLKQLARDYEAEAVVVEKANSSAHTVRR